VPWIRGQARGRAWVASGRHFPLVALQWVPEILGSPAAHGPALRWGAAPRGTGLLPPAVTPGLGSLHRGRSAPAG